MQVVKGRIEVLGQSKVLDRVTQYAYIRFLSNDGQMVMLNRVVSVNLVDSFLHPGVEGVFVFWQSTSLGYTLMGLRIGDREITAVNDVKAVVASVKATWTGYLIMGCITSFLIIGIVVVILAIINLSTTVPSEQEVRHALAS